MDLALAQLALIFLPGIIWARIDAVFGSGPKVDNAKLALNSFLFGVTTYVTLFYLYSFKGWEFSSDAIVSNANPNFDAFVDEIALSIPLSFLLSILWLYSVRFRFLMRFLNWCKSTTRFGLEDVWSFTFNSNLAHVEYVNIRDLKNGFIHSGYVNAYSETEDFRELLLVEAISYNEQGQEISVSPHLYLAFEKDAVWIEFPMEDTNVKKRN